MVEAIAILDQKLEPGGRAEVDPAQAEESLEVVGHMMEKERIQGKDTGTDGLEGHKDTNISYQGKGTQVVVEGEAHWET